LYLTENYGHVRTIDITTTTSSATTTVATLAGGGSDPENSDFTKISFQTPSGLLRVGSDLWLTDTSNYVVRRLLLGTAKAEIIAGAVQHSGTTDGPVAQARFDYPYRLSAAPNGDLFIVDDVIRRITVAGQVA